jgi:hypothetical protein
MVDWSPRGPQPRGLSPQIFLSKNNSKKINFPILLGKFAEKPLGLQTFITFQPQLQIQLFFRQNSRNHFLFLFVQSYNTYLLHFID